jgi:hypothetical protein
VARVDGNIGAMELLRAHPAQAEPYLVAAIARFEALGLVQERIGELLDDPANDGPPADVAENERIRLLRAELAWRRGDGDGALAVLDAFDAEFPKSSLADEVVVIRIDALVRTGRTARAAELARAFVARKPASPYAARLRTIAERETTNP